MKLTHTLLALLASFHPALSTLTLSSGSHYAVLNLDLLNILVEGFAVPNPTGQLFIADTATWISAIHALSPQPLMIFTRLYFTNPSNPELGRQTPFAKIVDPLLPLQQSTPATMIYPSFPVYANDTVLQKTRYYAGAGNALELILKAQDIDTVILSGLRTSGVVLDTAYRLFDADFNVYIISDCTLETPVGAASEAVQSAILGPGGIVEKMGGMVITLKEALEALGA